MFPHGQPTYRRAHRCHPARLGPRRSPCPSPHRSRYQRASLKAKNMNDRPRFIAVTAPGQIPTIVEAWYDSMTGEQLFSTYELSCDSYAQRDSHLAEILAANGLEDQQSVFDRLRGANAK